MFTISGDNLGACWVIKVWMKQGELCVETVDSVLKDTADGKGGWGRIEIKVWSERGGRKQRKMWVR